MPDGGRLGVHVLESTDASSNVHGLAVCVTDTGLGIGPAEANRLFEPFFSTKADKGTGLGLWISKGIVQKYGGSISFRSLKRKAGTTTCFRVFLPTNFCINKRVRETGRMGREQGSDQFDPETVLTNSTAPGYGVA